MGEGKYQEQVGLCEAAGEDALAREADREHECLIARYEADLKALTWRKKDGEYVALEKMSVEHLQNTISMLRQKGIEKLEQTGFPARRWVREMQHELLQRKEESELNGKEER